MGSQLFCRVPIQISMKFVRDPHSPPFRGRWGSGLGLGIGESHEQAPGLRRSNWEQLFEAALLESDTVVLGQRFQDANDAIMEEIEDPRSQTDRHALVAALNAIRELRRLSAVNDSQPAQSQAQ